MYDMMPLKEFSISLKLSRDEIIAVCNLLAVIVLGDVGTIGRHSSNIGRMLGVRSGWSSSVGPIPVSSTSTVSIVCEASTSA